MARIAEKKQAENLKRLGIEIQTRYLDGDHYVVKSTEEKNNDIQSVENGVIIEKLYFKDGVPGKRLNRFDTGITYKFITSEDETKEISCPNCGHTAKGKEFADGCPYCGTIYNIEYQDKKMGTKDYYNMVMKSDKYIKYTFLVDFIICMTAMLIYILKTGRTFNLYDIMKVAIGGILASFFLFAVFYVLDAFVITLPVAIMKGRENEQQKLFWDRMAQKGIDQKTVFNGFHSELRDYLYKNEKIIDYDVLDYVKFQEEDKAVDAIRITAILRTVFYEEKQFKVKEEKTDFVLHRSKEGRIRLKGGMNLLICPNCGASMSAEENVCRYCGRSVI